MPNKRLPMRKIKEVLRLKYICGLGEREIAQSCRVSRATVGNYLKRAEATGLSWSSGGRIKRGRIRQQIINQKRALLSSSGFAPR